MPYKPAESRYNAMPYNRVGRSGLLLPAISLGLWQNFGQDDSYTNAMELLTTAFDLGITHFDLANNYGHPAGSAEINLGKILKQNFKGYRDELVISTKAGYRMWPGPYGRNGSRKYMLASLDQSLRRLELEYVDIFYSHCYDPETPLEETMGALATAVKQGKALYVGISSYSAENTRLACAILRSLGTPCLLHQPSYSMLNRWIEEDLLGVLEKEGVGCIAFSPLAQGILSDKYLAGVPQNSRAGKKAPSFRPNFLNQENLDKIRELNAIALKRGQTLAQMALVWCLRNANVSSVLIGASRAAQLEENVKALENREFSKGELKEIDRFAVDGGINIWKKSSEA